MTTKFHLHLQKVVASLALTFAWAGPVLTVRAQEPAAAPAGEKIPGDADAGAKQDRKKRLDEMRRMVEGTKITLRDNADKAPAKLVAEPVLRYDSQFHGVVDGTMWVNGIKGRPMAVQKMELTRTPYLNGYYYCLASLSDGLIEVGWPGEPTWLSTKPGVEMRQLPNGPKPASTDGKRMLQMKEEIRRFAATRINAGDIREENRLLPRPIHRYRDPESGLQDGALFAFVANGTNPDFIMVLELRGPDLARATWSYGPARMTTGELHLRLDGKEAWTVPWEWVPGRNVYPTYVHFGPSRQEPTR